MLPPALRRRSAWARLLFAALVLGFRCAAEPADDDDGGGPDAASDDSGGDADQNQDLNASIPSMSFAVSQASDADLGEGDSDPSPPDNPPPPPSAPSATLTAEPGTGTTPFTVTVAWTTADAESAVVSGSGLASADLSGWQEVELTVPGTYTYSLTASGPGGQVTQTATVSAAAPEYALTTYAVGDGSVTPGGTYPAGTTISVSAAPAADAYFGGWSGSYGGSANPLSITLNGDTVLYANFPARQAQTIAFSAPAQAPFPGPPVALAASASSGLPVALSIASGPATLNGSVLTLTGTGPVTVNASQAGNGEWLPAPTVSQTIDAAAPPAIGRMRFNSLGRDARVSAGTASPGGSFLWTDPAGIEDSPWPTFANPQPAAAGPSNAALAPAPQAEAGIH